MLREGSRLCLGGCHLQMYTYIGPYGIFFEVFLFFVFVVFALCCGMDVVDKAAEDIGGLTD